MTLSKFYGAQSGTRIGSVCIVGFSLLIIPLLLPFTEVRCSVAKTRHHIIMTFLFTLGA